MAKTPEAKVKEQVVKILKEANVWYCFPVASGYGRSGIPDILACCKGLFVGIECKSEGNEPTALQRRELDQIADSGGTVWVVNETSLSLFKRWCLNVVIEKHVS